jgi:hypothetical protein
LNRIGDHSIEPANAIFSSHADPAGVIQWRYSYSLEQGGKLCLGAHRWNADFGLC